MAAPSALTSECPDDQEFVDLLEGRPAETRGEIRRHLASCEACRALVEELLHDEDELTKVIADALRETPDVIVPADRPAPDRPAEPRQTIGRYRVLFLIGRGGMGEVHAAYDPELDRKVALKLLHTPRADAGARERLLREARALGRLSHPNVVQVHDVGEHEGDVFVAMELVEGKAFSAWCRNPPRPGWQAVLAAYLDAARGLAAAHDKGLVHRDVKPSNILYGEDGRVRVVDFGLAAGTEASPASPGDDLFVDAGARAESLTVTGSIVGTPRYMAPEQHEGKRATPASDQYGLCKSLYEALYGALPFGEPVTEVWPSRGARLAEVATRNGGHDGGDPQPPVTGVPSKQAAAVPAPPPPGSSVPAWVHAALVRGLSARPLDRFPSMAALIAALSGPPSTDDAAPAGRVPRPITPLVGRVEELREIKERLGASRLVTLTGAGGVGKSRLAVQAAIDLGGTFPGGAYFVELAPLGDPDLVVPTVAAVLGVHEAASPASRPLVDALAASLRGRRVFLVLDNCEHVLDAASRLADRLLGAAADLWILATSRQPLGLTGEVAWRVPSLVAAEAVALFQERAGLRDDPETVAHICERLDGIPLAIELCAARTRALSVAQIAARLDDRFRLLTGGSRAALPRHRTLKAAVDWGYRLLDEEEQALLRLLSVFAGGCTLESAEAVAGDARGTLDTLANLVDKSLVVFSGGRYRLLETVRQYAAERLAERGETVEARARHLDHFVDLCRTAEPHIFAGVNGRGYLERLESENDNLRAALDFCQLDPGRAVAGLRLATGMHWFWFVRGHLREGLGRTTAALARREAAPAPLRARGLAAAALLSLWVGDAAATAAFAAESAALAKSLGDPWVHASALCAGGAAALHTGDLDGAARLLTEGVALARVTGHDLMLAFALYWMATAELARGDLTAARAALAEDLELVRRRGHTMGLGHALLRLGEVAEAEANLDEARRHYLDSTRHVDPTDGWGLAQVLDGLGRVSVGEGRPDRGARLFGAVEALCERTGAQIRDSEPQRRAVAEAHRALGEPAFAAAWAEGRGLRQDEAIALACEDA